MGFSPCPKPGYFILTLGHAQVPGVPSQEQGENPAPSLPCSGMHGVAGKTSLCALHMGQQLSREASEAASDFQNHSSSHSPRAVSSHPSLHKHFPSTPGEEQGCN